jgi:hypothetical protein
VTNDETDSELVAAVVDGHFEMLWPDGAWLPEPLPTAMVVGKPNAEGWIQWKTVPSPVTSEELREVEQRLPGPLPAVMRKYFQYRCILGTEGILLPEVPADGPLDPFLQEVAAWSPLLEAGYIPFAEYGDGYGPVCLDTLRPCGTDDFAVIWIDHEDIHALGEEDARQRSNLESLAKPLYPSFRDLMRAIRDGAVFPR